VAGGDVKFSTDPELVSKVADVLALHLYLPENAIVLSIDEKSQIQALNRTKKTLPMQSGSPRNAPTITSGTAPPPCLPHSRSPPARSPERANRDTGTKSS
jgi:hypothetical protein